MILGGKSCKKNKGKRVKVRVRNCRITVGRGCTKEEKEERWGVAGRGTGSITGCGVKRRRGGEARC